MSVTAFLTDSTLCIGCKACEVACKEWNQLSEDGLDWSGYTYDNTGALGASTWRHVKFLEEPPTPGVGGNAGEQATWVFSSDVCKHCEIAGCLEACPIGALVRTEFGGVFLQHDVVTDAPIASWRVHSEWSTRIMTTDAHSSALFAMTGKKSGFTLPAPKLARPSRSSSARNQLRAEAEERDRVLEQRGMQDASFYNPTHTSVGGIHTMFIVRGDARRYNLPPNPEVPTHYLRKGWTSAAISAGLLLGGTLLAFLTDSARERR